MDMYYKFKAFDEYVVDNLTKKKIWYANPIEFNDIFDSEIMIKLARREYPLEELHKKYISGELDRNNYEQLLNALAFDTSILSLSKNLLSNTMWAHYADYHKGFCMGFNCEHNKGFVHKVKYNDKYTIPDTLCTDVKAKNELFLQKSAEWEYEDEYRVIKILGNVENIKNYAIAMRNIEKQDKICKKIDLLIDLISNNYFDDKLKEQISKIINELIMMPCELPTQALLKQINDEVFAKGCLGPYPGELTTIVFGYRMSLDNKLKVREALKQDTNISYKKIVISDYSYILSLEDDVL